MSAKTFDHSACTISKTSTQRPATDIDRPSSTVLPAGYAKSPNSRSLPCDIHYEHNQPFAMRDGCHLSVDIFRPVSSEPVPAIIMWSPYGKSGTGPWNLGTAALRSGVAEKRISGYESFEGLDPAEWVQKGYAIVNADARGAGDSGGDVRYWGSAEGEDGHDLVEQIAVQPWCTGRVALAGNSWLAMSQWFIAAQQPPHLTAVAPLEGSGDMLREMLVRGGVPSLGFLNMIQDSLPGRQQQEDIMEMFARRPDGGPYWDDKRADFSKIEVPAYILGSYSTNLHTLGAFRAYDEITHEQKWLSVHDTQEWHDLYSSHRTSDLHKFFDFYCKDVQNGWDQTPAVRYKVLGYNRTSEEVVLPGLPWMQPGSKSLRLHLNADRSLTDNKPRGDETAVLEYQADVPAMNRDDDDGELMFIHTFIKKTIVVGPSTLTVHVSAEKQNDLDVYVMLRKADANGVLLQNINQPLSDLGVSTADEVPSVAVLKYLGPQGILRASKRAVDPELSSSWWRTLSHKKGEEVTMGSIVKLQIDLWPSGMIFDKGEKLVLKISGHDMRLVDFEMLQGSFQVANEGRHFVHLGGEMQNYLDLHIL